VDVSAFDAVVTGRVQGVGFRYYAQEHAAGLGLRGYVRNCGDGSVEIHAEGGLEDLKTFLLRLEKGPGHSRVDNLTFNWCVPSGTFTRFIIDY
jgi:acylphosphatase